MMEEISVLNRSKIDLDRRAGTNSNIAKFSPERTTINHPIDNLIAEGGEHFFQYLKLLDLANGSNLLVLSSYHHYYYDFNELKGVKTLINVKELNVMKHLNSFLYTIYNGLSPKTNFIGCFSDRKTRNGMGLSARMYKGFINFLDSRIDRDLNRNKVFEILGKNGFEIIDMKEMNGLTYFYSQNVPRLAESTCKSNIRHTQPVFPSVQLLRS